MAKKETYFFPHDYNPTNDPKIMALLGEYGGAGYGLYWRIIEMLHEDSEHKLPTKQYLINAIAKQMHSTSDFVSQFINDCVNVFELFKQEHDMIFCDRVFRNINHRKEKTDTAKANARARWDAVAMQTNATAMQTDANKGNNTKGDKRKRESKVFVAPSATEVQEYFLSNGYSEIAGQKAFEYYTSANWHDSQGKQVKNWKQKMQGVWFKDEHKTAMPIQSAQNFDRNNPNSYI